jgi:3-hydroxyacyl-[acyl-carrier protein] dehydratase/trans-2-decenoyl-[acyl-carrier protein] isomerase
MRFRGQITPETRLVRYEVSIRQVRRGRLPIGVADGSVYADEICVYVAKDMRVTLIGGTASE